MNIDIWFMIVGVGVEVVICECLIYEMGMFNWIFLVGNCKNVGFYLNKVDLVLYFVEIEGLFNVLIEV